MKALIGIGILNALALSLAVGPSLDTLLQKSRRNNRREEVHLEPPSYAITIRLTNDSSSASTSEVHSQGDFIVVAPPQHGIMLVVQSLRLRTHVIYADQYETTYLKCRDVLKMSAGNHSSQVCGHVMKYSKDEIPGGLLGQRTFITSEANLLVSFFVDTEIADNNYSWHETIAVELVITAFTSCPRRNVVTQWVKKLTGGNGLRSCSPSEDRICIYVPNFCDGFSNCIQGPLGHIGYDEALCSQTPHGPPEPPLLRNPATTPAPTTRIPYIGLNKPYSPPTGAVISPIHLILIFSTIVLVIFGACTWLAKANEKKFQHTMYRFSTIRRNRRNNGGRVDDRRNEETRNRRPSAPPPSSQAADVDNELELQNGVLDVLEETGGEEPPPYDDLFPTAPPQPETPQYIQ